MLSSANKLSEEPKKIAICNSYFKGTIRNPNGKMKVVTSPLTNIVWTSIWATTPALLLGSVLIGFRRPSASMAISEKYGENLPFIIPILTYVVGWIVIYFFRLLKRPSFIEWKGGELVVGYLGRKRKFIALSDIIKVEHVNPTKHEQILRFNTNANFDFAITLDEYEARTARKKLKEDRVEVEDVFLNQPRIDSWFSRKS